MSRWPQLLRFARALAFVVMSAIPVSTRGAPPDAGTGSAPVPSPECLAPPVVDEPPYKAGERARADGAVVASVDDETLARWSVGGSSNPACPSNRAGFHPAPRVKVDALVGRGQLPPRSSGKGVLSELGVLAQARNRGYWPFRLCFEAGLRRYGGLSGKTSIRMIVGRGGTTSRNRLGHTELHDREVSSCLVTQSRVLRFAPAPRRPVDVELSIDLTPGDAPLPDGAGASAACDPGPGKLDVPAVRAALGPALPRIAACYAEGRARDPGLWGRLALRFDVASDGVVRHVAEHDTRFPAPGVVECVLGALRGRVLPRVEGGPLRFVWGLRFGAPPPQESPRNVLPQLGEKSSVAESPPRRVRLGP